MTQTAPPTGPLLQEMWNTRLHRFPREGKGAGVCIGVARRYGIDPLLVRVAFVVATFFGGGGIPVYLACWLLLPRDGDEVSAGEALIGRGHSSEPRNRTILVVIGLGITGSSLLGGGFGRGFTSSGVVGAALLLGALVLLHRRVPAELPAPREAADPTTPVADRSTPPSWDPLGAAPFAWDLPEPPAPHGSPAPRRSRSRHTTVTLGLALLVVGAAVALRLLTDSGWLTASRIGALALAVVGVGLVVGAFRRRGWGLLVVTGPLIGFVVISSLVSGPPDWWQHGQPGFGDQHISVTDGSQLKSDYQAGVGNLTLDLRGLSLNRNEAVSVHSGLGNVTVLLPPGLDVNVDCHSGIGNTDCRSGLDVGNDGPGGSVLTLDLHSGVGNLEVHRG